MIFSPGGVAFCRLDIFQRYILSWKLASWSWCPQLLSFVGSFGPGWNSQLTLTTAGASDSGSAESMHVFSFSFFECTNCSNFAAPLVVSLLSCLLLDHESLLRRTHNHHLFLPCKQDSPPWKTRFFITDCSSLHECCLQELGRHSTHQISSSSNGCAVRLDHYIIVQRLHSVPK
jgi:zinc transporter ZupT